MGSFTFGAAFTLGRLPKVMVDCER